MTEKIPAPNIMSAQIFFCDNRTKKNSLKSKKNRTIFGTTAKKRVTQVKEPS
jgi:hypothetical protein